MAAVIFIVAPLVAIILNSFSSVAYNVFPPEGYSLRWYKNLAAQTDFYAAAGRSVLLASLTTILSLIIGTMAAYALTRYRLVGKNIIQGFLLSPIVLPKIVLGVAVFMFFLQIGVVRSYSSLLLTHTLVSMPFVIAIVAAALLNFDWTVQEAAMDLGAGPITTFVRVIMPEISVSVTLAAGTGLHDVLRSGGDDTLPSSARRGDAAHRDVRLSAEVAGPHDRRAFGCADLLRRAAGGRAQPIDPQPSAQRAACQT